MEFCPTCGMLLQIEPAGNGRKMRFFCPTCPYICPINNKIVRKEPLIKKEIEPIFNESDAMKDNAKTSAVCPRCHHGEAYFLQMQIRSADEPMTTFYKCCKCEYNWRED